MNAQKTNYKTECGLTIYDLCPLNGELMAVAGPDGFDPVSIDPECLPDGFRWIDGEEWQLAQEKAVAVADLELFEVSWECMGRMSKNAVIAASAVAVAMEQLESTELTQRTLEIAVEVLGDGWDVASVESLIENFSFEVV